MNATRAGLSAILVGAFCGTAFSAQATGCLKGAVVGAVAGHVAGHHAIVGAVAGCAIGKHMASRHKHDKDAQTRVDQGNQ